MKIFFSDEKEEHSKNLLFKRVVIASKKNNIINKLISLHLPKAVQPTIISCQ